MKALPIAPWLTMTLITLLASAPADATCTNRNANILLSKPDSIYIDHGDGTVTDTQTGLMWQKCPEGSRWRKGIAMDGGHVQCLDSISVLTWLEAMESAQIANTACDWSCTIIGEHGYTDWRVPNVKELASLVEPACWDPSINERYFRAFHIGTTLHDSYWSSTAAVGSQAFAVEFYGNSIVQMTKDNRNYVRLVRDSN